MNVVPLASGSDGNAYVVLQDGRALLIDCGICWRTLAARLAASPVLSGVTFDGVLLTHNHTDHTKGLKGFLKNNSSVSVYSNVLTAEAVAVQEKIADEAFACFENGQAFEIGPFIVSPFAIPHDAADPVGFLVSSGSQTYFHGTDIGTPLDSVGLKLAEADLATLESNHDPELLRTSGRPPMLIQRILGPRGHLANEAAADLVKRFASPRLKKLALGHLSRACNRPHLALQAMRSALLSMNRCDIQILALTAEGKGCA